MTLEMFVDGVPLTSAERAHAWHWQALPFSSALFEDDLFVRWIDGDPGLIIIVPRSWLRKSPFADEDDCLLELNASNTFRHCSVCVQV